MLLLKVLSPALVILKHSSTHFPGATGYQCKDSKQISDLCTKPTSVYCPTTFCALRKDGGSKIQMHSQY